MANVVQIVIDAVDNTQDVFSKAMSGMDGLGKAAVIMAGAVAGAGAWAAAKIVGLTASGIAAADEIGKQAQKVGLATEEWSKLRHALEVSEVSAEAFITASKKLSSQIDDARNGSASAQAVFDRLGVAYTDAAGNVRNLQDVLLDVADSFAGHRDGAEKASIAQDLFGKGALDLIPILNEGAAGIKELKDEAEALSLVIKDKTAKEAGAFQDNLDRLKAAASGLGRAIAADVLPTLVQWGNALVALIKNNNILAAVLGILRDTAAFVSNAFTAIARSILGVLTPIAVIEQVIVRAAKTIGEFIGGVAASWSLLFEMKPDAANEAMKTTVNQLGANMTALKTILEEGRKSIEEDMKAVAKALTSGPALFKPQEIKIAKIETVDITKTTTTTTTGTSGEAGKPTFAPPIDNTAAQKSFENAAKIESATLKMWDVLRGESARSNNDLVEQSENRLQAQLEQINNLGASEEDFYALREQAFTNHQDRLTEIQLAAEQRRNDEQMQLMRDVGQLESSIKNDLLTDDFSRQEQHALDVYTTRSQAIAKLNLEEEQALELAWKNQEAHEKSMKRVQNEKVKFTLGTMKTLAEAAKVFGKSGFAVWKAISMGEAIISTALAVTNALATGKFPFNVMLAASIGAMGAAQIAIIAAAKPGVAHAGLSYVPSEATYVLDRGERVLAPRQNEDLTAFLDAQKGGPMHVTVNLDGRQILDWIGEASQMGTLEISSKAVV